MDAEREMIRNINSSSRLVGHTQTNSVCGAQIAYKQGSVHLVTATSTITTC